MTSTAFSESDARQWVGRPQIADYLHGVADRFFRKEDVLERVVLHTLTQHVDRHGADVIEFEESSDNSTAPETQAHSTLARIGASRRMAEIENPEAATQLAVHYQLISKWTNCIVVHERAEGEKAEDLPVTIKVPQLFAAGSHGAGSVMDVRSLSIDASYDMDLEHLRTIRPERLSERELTHALREAQKRAVDEARQSGPDEFAALLNGRSLRPAPSLDDLEEWGLPAQVMARLRQLVDQGNLENAIVIVALYLLSQSPVGVALDRPVRREIVKAYKAIGPDDAITEAVANMIEPWLGQTET